MAMTGEQFAETREDLGLTQTEIGMRLGGYALRTVQSWEADERGVPPAVEALISALEQNERLVEAVMNLLTKRSLAAEIAKEEIELATGMQYSEYLAKFKKMCGTIDGFKKTTN